MLLITYSCISLSRVISLWLHCSCFKGIKSTNTTGMEYFVRFNHVSIKILLLSFSVCFCGFHQHFKSVQQRDDDLNGGPSYRAQKCSAECFELQYISVIMPLLCPAECLCYSSNKQEENVYSDLILWSWQGKVWIEKNGITCDHTCSLSR